MATDPEKVRATLARFRARHKAELAAKQKAYRIAHRDEHLAREKAYRDANRERLHAKARAYRQEHKEAISARFRSKYPAKKAELRARGKAYYEAHKVEISIKVRPRRALYRATHKAEIAAKRRVYHEAHKAEINARNAAWRAANPRHYAAYCATHPEIINAINARRRARQASAPVNDLTAAQWREIKEHYDHRCVYCGRKMQRLTKDHITPLKRGGAHTASNIVPACVSCNSKKKTGPPLCPVQPLLFTVAPARKKKVS